MRPGVFITYLVVAVALSVACSSRPDSLKQEAESGEVVLRMSTISEGNVYPEGDILDINLREDGTFEYDDWPEQPPPNYTAGNVVTTRKQARLSPDDVKELLSIAEQPDFQGAAETYPYPGPGVPTDVLERTVVTYIHGGKM